MKLLEKRRRKQLSRLFQIWGYVFMALMFINIIALLFILRSGNMTIVGTFIVLIFIFSLTFLILGVVSAGYRTKLEVYRKFIDKWREYHRVNIIMSYVEQGKIAEARKMVHDIKTDSLMNIAYSHVITSGCYSSDNLISTECKEIVKSWKEDYFNPNNVQFNDKK